MNKYFVVSDVHGFYNEMCEALDSAGYDPTNPSHWLISCGDNFDRGPENFKVMWYFLRQPRCILVRGNHEDLLDYACTEGISMRDYPNGTVDTIEELGASATRLDWTMDDKMDLTFKRTRGFFDRMIDFYETKNYVFVHGWIPSLKLYPDWRKAPTSAWEKARWENGMKAARSGHLDPAGKTIVCGHYHTSWGHHIQSGTPEWGEGSDFRIYYDKGIIAIDGCTAYTGKVNVLVIEDEPLEDCNSAADYPAAT